MDQSAFRAVSSVEAAENVSIDQMKADLFPVLAGLARHAQQKWLPGNSDYRRQGCLGRAGVTTCGLLPDFPFTRALSSRRTSMSALQDDLRHGCGGMDLAGVSIYDFERQCVVDV